jgi:hypothetical protein
LIAVFDRVGDQLCDGQHEIIDIIITDA